MSAILETVVRLAREKQKFILYSLIGLSGASLDYVVFLALLKLNTLHYLIANTISTSCGILNNFVINARYNFGVRDRLWSRFLSFASVGVLGMAIASGLLYLFKTYTPVPLGITKGIAIFVIVVVQYNLNRRIAFHTKPTI